MTAEYAMATIRLNSNELDMNFVEGIKTLFPNRQITLRLEVFDEAEEFEREMLRRVHELDEGHGITFTAEEFNAFVAKLP